MQRTQPQPSPDWHKLTSQQILRSLGSDLDSGLSAEAVRIRAMEHGPNTITPKKGAGPFRRVLAQFTQPLVLILLAAGAVTAILEEWVDSGVIFGVVLINAVIGYLQETKAVKAIAALSRSMSTEATVIRDGRRQRLPASELVPGDVVVVQAGDKVPADMRLTYARDLRVDESALTGESVPVDKETQPLAADTPLADRVNMSYAATLVAAGQGTGLVVATGDGTEMGRISSLIAEAEEHRTPLTQRIVQFSRILLFVILALAALTVLIGVLRGESAAEMFLAAVALAVGAIPEGLPAAVTITLAIGVSRMARRRAIIRKLPAVETLGSTTVICSDKTGTLTENQMTVQRIEFPDAVYTVTGGGYAPEGNIITGPTDPGPVESVGNALAEVLRAGVLCNDSSLYQEDELWHVNGDPTEAALLVSAAKGGINSEEANRLLPRLDTVPFESEHRYMATLHRAGGDDGEDRVAYVKGAVERVLARCSKQLSADASLEPLAPSQIDLAATKMASAGLRVLAFARKQMEPGVDEITHEQLDEGLVFLGLQGMIDPPREEAKRSIQACHAAGIQVKMITGDHVLTARAIAQQLGMRPPECLDQELKTVTGAELDEIDPGDLAPTVEATHVFARVTSEQKLRLVDALQDQNHVVAMTGDGVNDAPALKQADIGVAMGAAGTEVAKEAADMVLTDGNFASIEAAVEEGRGVFDNLKKFIAWTLPTNLGEGLVILAAVFAGVALPILPVQILWINMTTAVLMGLMLAFEPKEAGIMQRPPRAPKTPILDRVLALRIFIVGTLLLIGAFGLFEYVEWSGGSLEQARTAAVNVFVFGEMFYLFNCRSLTLASWRSSLRANRFLLGGVGLMLALQLIYTYLPGMNRLFGSEPLDGLMWGLVICVAVVIHLVVEMEKWVGRILASRRPAPEVC